MPVQTTYDLAPPVAAAGLLQDSRFAESDSFVAGEDIPFGRIVELNTADGRVYLPKSASLGRVAGVALYPVTGEPKTGTAGPTNAYGWKAGDRVQVLRKGRVWMECLGTSPTLAQSFTTANVAHASTDGSGNAQHRGKATANATSATAGAEITALPAAFTFCPPPSAAPAGFALVGVALP